MGAKEAVTSTRDVISGQISVLRIHRMSPAEFRWLEKIIYRRWLPAVGDGGFAIGTDEVRYPDQRWSGEGGVALRVPFVRVPRITLLQCDTWHPSVAPQGGGCSGRRVWELRVVKVDVP
jgi:hypothetical protein